MDMPHHHVPTATATSTMDVTAATGSMDSMDSMGMSSIIGSAGQVCKVQMLWNWNTIGACFITPQWQIANRGSMIGTCFGVVILVIVLEVLRRATKEFDRWIIRRHRRAAEARANQQQQQNPPQIPPLGLADSPAAATAQNSPAASNPEIQAAGGQGAAAQAPKSTGTATVANVGGGDGAGDDIAPAPAPAPGAAAGAGAAAAGAKEEQPGQQAPEGAAAAAPEQRRLPEACPLFRYLGRLGPCFRPAAAGSGGDGGVPRPCRPNLWQQGLRALLHTAQFTVAYFIMLLVALTVYPSSDFVILVVWVAKCRDVRCGRDDPVHVD
ncbi:Copper Transporter integral membrane protein that functions in high affinity copper transport [Cytospora paraplurivora]|uniref:Copper transport protein n=1 Tax=Cytospora paraplurivora TaxID=2898453 RepID=A0AAN9U3N1_9PEZI